jgi:hypothetical protein
MKKICIAGVLLSAALLFSACTENLDPLTPGSADGQYSLGVKALVPLAVGNQWNYAVVLYDTTGAERTRYTYTLSVVDTVTADTSLIPLIPPNTTRKNLKREALVWYLLQGEMGARTCWQVDSVENLTVRQANDARFYEQTAFNFRASLGDVTPARYVGADTTVWGSGDKIITRPDSVLSTLVSKGVDSLRTTLGSAPYFAYKQSYVTRTEYTNYYFKPGFGLFLVEKFQQTPGGKIVRVRRDELVSYYFK